MKRGIIASRSPHQRGRCPAGQRGVCSLALPQVPMKPERSHHPPLVTFADISPATWGDWSVRRRCAPSPALHHPPNHQEDIMPATTIDYDAIEAELLELAAALDECVARLRHRPKPRPKTRPTQKLQADRDDVGHSPAAPLPAASAVFRPGARDRRHPPADNRQSRPILISREERSERSEVPCRTSLIPAF
jgi:hypothetical protein